MGVDVLCDSAGGPDFNWRGVVRVTNGAASGSPGHRQFAIYRKPGANTYEVDHNDRVGSGKHMNVASVDCTEGEWNSFDVLQTENSFGFVSYSVKMDGNEILSGSYAPEFTPTTGSFSFFAADGLLYAAESYKIKNFFYHAIEPTPSACDSDPCAGLENCTTLVNGCAIHPSMNNVLGTVETSTSYKIGLDVLCNASGRLDGNWRNIIRLDNGAGAGQPGFRQFGIWRHPSKNTYEINHNDGSAGSNKKAFTIDCTQGEWNSFDVVQTDNLDGIVSYSVKMDGFEVLSGTYEAKDTPSSGSFTAYASDAITYAAESYAVKNFFYQKN